MFSKDRTWNLAFYSSYAALLTMLARTFLDYQYVYRELGLDAQVSGLATLINLALFGGWIFALLTSMQSSRRGMIANLAFNSLTLIFGISTVVALCPSPCPTGWPVGEIIIWSNILIGATAVILTAREIFRPVPESQTPGNRMSANA